MYHFSLSLQLIGLIDVSLGGFFGSNLIESDSHFEMSMIVCELANEPKNQRYSCRLMMDIRCAGDGSRRTEIRALDCGSSRVLLCINGNQLGARSLIRIPIVPVGSEPIEWIRIRAQRARSHIATRASSLQAYSARLSNSREYLKVVDIKLARFE